MGYYVSGVRCEECRTRAVVHDDVSGRNLFAYLRKEKGWRIGQHDLCPDCAAGEKKAKEKRRIQRIGCLDDFLRHNEAILYRGGVQPSHCLNYRHDVFWEFTGGYDEAALNRDIEDNREMFDWVEDKGFYYANDNMFSPSNEARGLKGFRLRIKKEEGARP